MTREEAIKKIDGRIDYLRREPSSELDDALRSGIRQGLEEGKALINALDEPKWHKVSEEGLPTETDLYLTCSDLYTYNLLLFQNNRFLLDGINFTDKIIAWQKITPYEG